MIKIIQTKVIIMIIQTKTMMMIRSFLRQLNGNNADDHLDQSNYHDQEFFEDDKWQ